MSALDPRIDDLYKLPLGDFTGARNALAKSLSKDDAKQIKGLEKPTVVPWAVNQVYWRARSTYDRVMNSGGKLRAAQIAALEGRNADVRAASEAHRRAIGEAVAEAERLSATAGVKPGADAIARTFESLSLATSSPETPGRLTQPLHPAGFEGLTGAKLELRTQHLELGTKPAKLELRKGNADQRTPDERRTPSEERLAEAAERAAAEAAAKDAAERKKHDAAVKAAEATLARVEAGERDARAAWEKAHDALLAARQALTDLRRTRFRSS